MRETASGKYLLLWVALATVMLLIMFQGCLSGGNPKYVDVSISGYVRTDSDSAAVPGAYISVSWQTGGKGTMRDIYTDGNGFYEYNHNYRIDDDGDSFSLKLTVVDVDGDTCGIFVSQDCVLRWENTEGISEITVSQDFYVHMVFAPTDIGQAPVL